MSKLRFRDRPACLGTFVLLSLCFCAMSGFAQSITWEILPWPSNQNWPGPQGSPATTNGNEIVLTGQDVLSTQVFTAPVTISYDVLLPAKSTTDGIIELYFVSTGEPTNLLPNPGIELTWFETQTGNDGLQVQQNQSTLLYGPVPQPLAAGTTYHVSVNVATNGQVSWAINGVDVGLGSSVIVPFASFQLRLSSWQPTQVWQISNFTVTAAPVITCPNITGTWTGQVNVVDSFRGYRATTLSVQVTDQNTNSCLLRGYLNPGSALSKVPWGLFNPASLWGRLPFTGTIIDTTSVILNFGILGQASATLDMSQTPPVLRKFILLSAGGAANGDTTVGDLTEQTSGP